MKNVNAGERALYMEGTKKKLKGSLSGKGFLIFKQNICISVRIGRLIPQVFENDFARLHGNLLDKAFSLLIHEPRTSLADS